MQSNYLPYPMCGRSSLHDHPTNILDRFSLPPALPGFSPRYNIAPSHGPGFEQAFVIQNRDGQRTLRQGRWWMIPHFWSKPLKALPATIRKRSLHR